MESFEDIKKTWAQNKVQPTTSAPLNQEYVNAVIKIKIKKERKTIWQYFWTSFFYHIFIYAALSHLMLRYWGDQQIMLLSIIGIVLYIPFTWLLLQKFKAIGNVTNQVSAPVRNMQETVRRQYTLLLEFYNLKKRFDWVAGPVSCLITVLIIFKLYVPGGLKDYFTGAMLTYAGTLFIYITAIWWENKKHFRKPLQALALILDEMER